ncbi:hypothetical protein [Nonomuraea sp. NPDC049684]|uniref:hypothetical protein n=1 Tax=Nonomuraea sp. NPDC049684 TaxID=3364356 RepID=UPI00378FCF11
MSEETVPQQPSYDRQDPAFWKYEFDRYVDAAMTATLAGRHIEALDAAHETRLAAERLQNVIVGNARAGGTSWSTIGRAAMLTKQAAWTRWKRVEAAGVTLASLEPQLVVVVTAGHRHIDEDNPNYGLDLADYLPVDYNSWGDVIMSDSRVEALLQEGIEDYWVRVAPLDWIAPRVPGLAKAVAADPDLDGGSPLVHPAMTQFALVLDTPDQMEELQGLFRTADIRKVLDAAAKTGRHTLGFDVGCNVRGDFYVSLVGHMSGVDISAELNAVTEVLTGAGYEVTPHPEHEACVFARLAARS